MVDTIQIATSAMLADVDRMRLISQNITNAATPGYRTELSSLHAPKSFADLLQSEALSSPGSVRSTTAGALQNTQRSLDLAIEGNGYFEIETARGIRYTRRGDFSIDAESKLVTSAGDPVMSSSGSLRLPNADVVVDSEGTIRATDTILGTVAVAIFDDDSQLIYEGEGLYRSEAIPTTAAVSADTRIRQGVLEASNVQPVEQMTQLMATVRHLGFSAQALRAYDQMLDAAINQSSQS